MAGRAYGCASIILMVTYSSGHVLASVLRNNACHFELWNDTDTVHSLSIVTHTNLHTISFRFVLGRHLVDNEELTCRRYLRHPVSIHRRKRGLKLGVVHAEKICDPGWFKF